jgi:hypothetical protein
MSSYQETPFRLRSAILDPAFEGGPQDLLAEFIRLTEVVSPTGFYGVISSDSLPSSNVGLVLLGGTKPYVWSQTQNEYIPADLSDSLVAVLAAIAALQAVDVTHNTQISALQAADTAATARLTALEALDAKGRVVFSNTTPATTDRVKILWVQTDSSGDVVESIRNWSVASNTWTTIIEFPLPIQYIEETRYAGERDYRPDPTRDHDRDFTLTLPTDKTWKEVEVFVDLRILGGSNSLEDLTATVKWNTDPMLDEPVMTGAEVGAGITGDLFVDEDNITASGVFFGQVPSDIAESATLGIRVTLSRNASGGTSNLYSANIAIRARATT